MVMLYFILKIYEFGFAEVWRPFEYVISHGLIHYYYYGKQLIWISILQLMEVCNIW